MCTCKAAHWTLVCHKTVYKKIKPDAIFCSIRSGLCLDLKSLFQGLGDIIRTSHWNYGTIYWCLLGMPARSVMTMSDRPWTHWNPAINLIITQCYRIILCTDFNCNIFDWGLINYLLFNLFNVPRYFVISLFQDIL